VGHEELSILIAIVVTALICRIHYKGKISDLIKAIDSLEKRIKEQEAKLDKVKWALKKEK